MIQALPSSLKQLFNDPNYAWDLLQTQVKIETSDQVTSQDVTNLLQLYMKGVQKMNSFLDFREAFFKQKVMTLMSRPNVMKTLNQKKVMSKKNIVVQAPISKQDKKQKLQSPSQDKNQSISPIGSGKKIQNKSEMLQLKQKKRQIEVRLAYGAQQNSPQNIQKLMSQQAHKQIKLTEKITKIAQIHEQRLANRIKQRKLKTAAKSLSNILVNDDGNHFFGSNRQITIQLKNQKKIQEAFGSCKVLQQRKQIDDNRKIKQGIKRRYNSLQPQRGSKLYTKNDSPLRKSISYNIGVQSNDQNIQNFDFSLLTS